MLNIVNPRQTVLVTSRAKTEIFGKEIEKDNIITVDWHTPISFNPEIYGIAIGKTRFSHELIKKSRSFVINFMPFEKQKDVLFCGRNSGKTIDKFKKTDLTKEEAETIDCPIVGECVAFLECELIQELELGDHTFFIGKILRKQQRSESKKIYHVINDRFTTTA